MKHEKAPKKPDRRQADMEHSRPSQEGAYPETQDQGFQGNQSAWPDERGQQGQYGTAPGNDYGNSPTNPYAKNPGGSPGMAEPWHDEPSGADPQSNRNAGGASSGAGAQRPRGQDK